MTVSDYAQKVVELIQARPNRIDLDKLLYEVYVQAKIVEGRRDREAGRWDNNETTMERMWKRIHSRSGGRSGRKEISKKSSMRSRKMLP